MSEDQDTGAVVLHLVIRQTGEHYQSDLLLATHLQECSRCRADAIAAAVSAMGSVHAQYQGAKDEYLGPVDAVPGSKRRRSH